MSTPLIITPSDPIIAHPDTVILDASWLYEPDPPTRDAYEEFLAGPRYPSARFWSLDEVSEPHEQGFPLMLPSPERFAKFAGDHGVTKSSHVVIYDSEGVFSAPRTAWTFKVYGHEKVSVIDGGLPRARSEGVKLETGLPRQFETTIYPTPSVVPGSVVEFDEIAQIAARSTILADDTVLIDARPATSYEGGHIPTSLSFDFPSALLRDPSGFTHLREPKDLRALFEEKVGVEAAARALSGKVSVVHTCGGGLSAAINWLHFQSLGVSSRLYDESWSGYSARKDTVRKTGPDPL
uniref:Rhodanese domain-containing protein n=1 Tax=Kwoniella dejecticola CBS 10117 TaxID=1296121 RepID=A0A1A5ZTC0_9TREE|nr:uncharacterized protein I303_08446 [Kwoniella dejecticola CBS 10117]OBR81064.1 hypothetical protein I303_08446 [Kwoniella dejecticola CBS 10117]